MRSAIPAAIISAPALATCTALTLYFTGGGFGGGHGPYDYWIYRLGMPATILLEHLPERWLDWFGEPVWLIVLPGCMNFLMFGIVAAGIYSAFGRRRQP